MLKSVPELIKEIKQNINEISVTELAEIIHSNPNTVLIDVRERGEFSESSIPQAVNFPRGVLESLLPTYPSVKDSEKPLEALNEHNIYLICRSGARSAFAAESLQRLGFDKVYSVAGGMMEWDNSQK